MFKKLVSLPAASLALVLTAVAANSVGTSKAFILYEPSVPECLKK